MEGMVLTMAKVLTRKRGRTRKPEREKANKDETLPCFLLPEEERALARRLAPYKMLERNDAHERRLAPKVKIAAKLAESLAGRLSKLGDLLVDIEQQRKGGPLAAWLWYRENALTGKEPPWKAKPERGPAFMVGLFADVLGGTIAGQLAEDATKLKERKGGRPREVIFNAACRLLEAEGRTDRQIAETLTRAGIARGAPSKVQERVCAALKRYADSTKPIHALAETVEILAEVDRTEQARWAEGGIPLAALIGSRDPTKTGRG